MATKQELSDFLRDTEKRAFKRAYYQVRDEQAALDIVQDSMIKLSVHYAEKPPAELPLLFSRILTNTTLDYFRKQRSHNAVFTNRDNFEGNDEEGFDLLETLEVEEEANEFSDSAEEILTRKDVIQAIDAAVQKLPARQREAFLYRYWEELDTAETAAAMGCSEGSVKVHCFRAVQSLAKTMQAQGITLRS